MLTKIMGLEIFDGALDTAKIYQKWYDFASQNNLGANSIFTGIVRAENGCDGLSFDIYKPLLEQWFLDWNKKVLENGVFLKMAHSRGDVFNHQSSYMAGIFSAKRRACLEVFEDFIEDFKHKAPIWKYDLKNGTRIYAKERSYKLPFSGILQ
ncbi:MULTISPECIES: molybdenum cofactor biosynthesis protein MoaE [unclassified Helicobacter]|uniref:molybdenum cofactor biosynthesis protein MoaE n=2 Tax=unclassified Helicobacter TaxID=2593540 RepID=UPI00215C7820|nr:MULTISPECIES: molybdenum cofactor biosynthesis protein MoaE [unclassified Helicobacter]MCI7765637.1 molybdenum cofactor biosynthesis protein MoaE [Helicobacter sp.]